MTGWLHVQYRSACLLFVVMWLLLPTPYAILPQEGFEGGLTDAVALGEYVYGESQS